MGKLDVIWLRRSGRIQTIGRTSLSPVLKGATLGKAGPGGGRRQPPQRPIEIRHEALGAQISPQKRARSSLRYAEWGADLERAEEKNVGLDRRALMQAGHGMQGCAFRKPKGWYQSTGPAGNNIYPARDHLRSPSLSQIMRSATWTGNYLYWLRTVTGNLRLCVLELLPGETTVSRL